MCGLCIYLVAEKTFKCSLNSNKKSYYRSFNSIFSKVGRCASEEVVVKLISAKCLPVLIYGLDACPIIQANQHALDFIMTRTFMRLFKTSSLDIVTECQLRFKVLQSFRNRCWQKM